MPTAEDVGEVLLGFTMLAFMRVEPAERESLDRKYEEPLFDLLGSVDSLTAAEATMLPVGMQALLRHLLFERIVELMHREGMEFPSGMLDGSSVATLGRPLLRNICERRWLCPRDVPWKKTATLQ